MSDKPTLPKTPNQRSPIKLPDPRRLGTRAAAAYCGIAVRKLREDSLAGKIPFAPGKYPHSPHLWRIADLDQYMERSLVRYPKKP